MNVAKPIGNPALETGTVVAGKFRIEHAIGGGGGGVVYLATHLQLDERVALKFLAAGDAERALAEARSCLRLKTKHVARVMDVGRHEDRPFIVMEYLEGKDLLALVEANGRFEDAHEAVELVVQVCEAVAEAHRAGIVHRDIKLANLFLVASRSAVPEVKLLDFGIATTEEAAGNKALGTLHYMAPEAVQGVTDDPRADLWSIGVVLFELLTGWKPFDSKEAVALIAEIYEESHLSLREYRDDLPAELEAVIDRCLEKDPEARFQSAGELAEALRPFAPERAHVDIDRALEASRAPQSARISTSGIPSAAPSRPNRSLRISDPAMRKSGPLRSSGSRRLRSSSSSTLSGSKSSVPTMTANATSSDVAAPKRNIAPWVLAGTALLVLGLVFGLRNSFGGKAADGRAATPPPAVTAAPTTPASPVTPSAPVATGEAPPPQPTTETPTALPPAHAPAGRQVFPARPPGPRGSTSAPSAVAATPSVSPTPAPTGGVEKDPWKSAKPKLDDNPFR